MNWTNKFRAYVAERHDEHVRELMRYVAQPSVSSTGEGMPDAAIYAAGLARRCGLDARLVAGISGHPAVLAQADGPPGTPHVLIYGHYDVQPPGPLQSWASPPFAPEVRDGRVYGRGTGDNKGQHLAHLLALRMLSELCGAMPCRVSVLLDGEEEIGSPHLPEIIDRCARDLAPDLVIVSDGPVLEDGSAVVKLGVRGVLTFELRARGARSPLHSGNWGGVAPNPAWRLVWLLATLRAPDGRLLIPGFAAGIKPLTAGEHAAVDELPVDPPTVLAEIGASAFDVPTDVGYFERLTGPTLSINSLTCEDDDKHRTVIPHVAIARCDARLADGQRSESVAAAIAAHVQRVAPDIEFVPAGHAIEPCRTLPESAYTGTIRDAIAAVLGGRVYVKPAMGGSLPLHVLADRLGTPCYGVPFANADEANHAPDENLQLSRFHDAIRVSASILQELAAHHRRTTAPEPSQR